MTTAKERSDTEAREAAFQEQVLEGECLPEDAEDAPETDSRWKDLLDRFALYLTGRRGSSPNTVRVYTTDLVPFFQFLDKEGLDPTEVGRPEVRRYLAWLSTKAKEQGRGRGNTGYARSSVARKLVVLRAFYRYLAQIGDIPANPIPNGRSLQVKVDKLLPVFLAKEETQRLVDAPDREKALGARDAVILELLYSCGFRLSELASLEVASFDASTREIRVMGKGSKERVVIVGRPATEAVADYLHWARPQLLSEAREPLPYGEDPLLLNRYGARLSRRSIEKIVATHATRASTRPGVHPHTLRHTFATHLMDGGADIRVVQELLGHASPTTTQIYTHVTQNQARQVYMASHPRARDAHPDDTPDQESPMEEAEE